MTNGRCSRTLSCGVVDDRNTFHAFVLPSSSYSFINILFSVFHSISFLYTAYSILHNLVFCISLYISFHSFLFPSSTFKSTVQISQPIDFITLHVLFLSMILSYLDFLLFSLMFCFTLYFIPFLFSNNKHHIQIFYFTCHQTFISIPFSIPCFIIVHSISIPLDLPFPILLKSTLRSLYHFRFPCSQSPFYPFLPSFSNPFSIPYYLMLPVRIPVCFALSFHSGCSCSPTNFPLHSAQIAITVTLKSPSSRNDKCAWPAPRIPSSGNLFNFHQL